MSAPGSPIPGRALTGAILAAWLSGLSGAAAAATARPARIVSLAPSLTEILFAVGAGDAVVGVTRYCDHPQAATTRAQVGGIEDGSIDLERVLALSPNLVLAIGDGQRSTVEALRRFGVRVEVLPGRRLVQVLGTIDRVGELAGRKAAARRLHADLHRRVERVRRAVGGVRAGRRPRVFYQLWDDPLMTGTRRTLIGELIELAGGVNLFADLPGAYPLVSLESVLERDPEVIVAPDHHAAPVSRETVLRRPGLAATSAVRTGRVLMVAGDTISRPGPRIVDALELLAQACHPELMRRSAAGPP